MITSQTNNKTDSHRTAIEQPSNTTEEVKNKRSKEYIAPLQNGEAEESSKEIPSWFFDIHKNFPEQKPNGKSGGKRGGIKNAWQSYDSLHEKSPEHAKTRVDLIPRYTELLRATPDRPSCSLSAWFGPKSTTWEAVTQFAKPAEVAKDSGERYSKFEKEILSEIEYTLSSWDTLEDVFKTCCALGSAGLTSKEITDAWGNYAFITSDPDRPSKGIYQKKFSAFMTEINVRAMLAKSDDDLKALRLERWGTLKNSKVERS